MHATGIGVAFLSLAGLATPTAGLYGSPPCDSDEVQGEVLGVSGTLCAPHCSNVGYTCPAAGGGARATCMLQDVDKNPFCGLFCDANSECPGNSECKPVERLQVSLCMHPSSFMDWARLGSSRKMVVQWSSFSSGFVASDPLVARAGRALDNIKTVHGLDDNDADIRALKDVLSTMQAGGGSSAPLTSIGGDASTLQATAPVVAAAAPPPARHPHTLSWVHDMQYIERAMADPIPGFEHGLQDTIWNIEHIEDRGKATELLRGVIWIALIYLIIGAAIKYQSHGAWGWHLIPHVEFWMDYPNLVADGIEYSKILLGGVSGADFAPKASSADGLTGGIRNTGGSGGGGVGAFEAL